MQHISQAKKDLRKQESQFISTLRHFEWHRSSPSPEQNDLSVMATTTTNASIRRNSIPRGSTPNLVTTQAFTYQSDLSQQALSARPSLSNLSSPIALKVDRKLPLTNKFFEDQSSEDLSVSLPIQSPNRNEIKTTQIRRIAFPTSSRSLKRLKTPNCKKEPSLSEICPDNEIQMSIIQSAGSIPPKQLSSSDHSTFFPNPEDIQPTIKRLTAIYNSGVKQNLASSPSPNQANKGLRSPYNQTQKRQEYYSPSFLNTNTTSSQLDSSTPLIQSTTQMGSSQSSLIQHQERNQLKKQVSSRYQTLLGSIVSCKQPTINEESNPSSFADIPLSIVQISEIIEDQRSKSPQQTLHAKSSLYIRSESMKRSQVLLRGKKATSRSPFHRSQKLFESMSGTTHYAKFAQRIAFNLVNLQQLCCNDEYLFRQIAKQLSFRHSALTDVFVQSAKKMQLTYRVDDIEKKLLKVDADFISQRKKFGKNSITSDQYISPEKLKEELRILDAKLESMCLVRIQSKVTNEFDSLSSSRDHVSHCLKNLIKKGQTEPAEMSTYRCNYLHQKLTYLPERIAFKSTHLGNFPFITKESLTVSQQIETRIADLTSFNKQLNNPYKSKKDQNFN